MNYDWLAVIAFVATFLLLSQALHRAVFRVPRFAEMRKLNRGVDKPKLAKEKYRAVAKTSMKAGTYTNLFFAVLVLPFFVSLESRPLWQHLAEIVGILAIFDFMYYWTHRSLFHGKWLRKVHSLHHLARKPTQVDAHYVHPVETTIGLALFLVSIPILSLIEGASLNAVSSAIAMIIFTSLNLLNHTWTKLPSDSRLDRTVDFVTGVHRAHHVDMNHGNYATLTMFYDKLFGTFEAPVMRETV